MILLASPGPHLRQDVVLLVFVYSATAGFAGGGSWRSE